jgi:uncharacterized protein YecT (DUF1311 family)
MRLVRFVFAVLLAASVLVPLARAQGDLQPPVIREPFARLPCPTHALTTLAMEGCSEKVLLATDRAINARAKTIFGVLPSAARKNFVAAEVAWLRYRRSSCLAEASGYSGGSIYPLEYAYCEVARNRTHLRDLAELRCGLYPQDAVPKSCRPTRS